MIVSETDIATLKMANNLVLLEPILKTDSVKFGEQEIYLDTTYNPQKHQPIVQKVIKAPKNLIFGKCTTWMENRINPEPIIPNADRIKPATKIIENELVAQPLPTSLPWKTSMELKPGDLVWVDYFSLITAESRKRVLFTDTKKYYLVSYENIYCKKDGDKVTMLNGWILVEPFKEEEEALKERLHNLGIILSDYTGFPDKFATVRYIGKPVEEYFDKEMEDTDEVSVGDVVRLVWGKNRRLENECHKWFSQADLIVTRRPRLIAKYKKGVI
jgi:hypothetical protein